MIGVLYRAFALNQVQLPTFSSRDYTHEAPTDLSVAADTAMLPVDVGYGIRPYTAGNTA